MVKLFLNLYCSGRFKPMIVKNFKTKYTNKQFENWGIKKSRHLTNTNAMVLILYYSLTRCYTIVANLIFVSCLTMA